MPVHPQPHSDRSSVPADLVGWLRALVQADVPRAVARQIVALVRGHPDCIDAQAVWRDEAGGGIAMEPAVPIPDADQTRLEAAWMQGVAQWSADGRRAALPLGAGRTAPVLLLSLDHGCDARTLPPDWEAPLQLGAGHMARVIELEALRKAMATLERSDQLQRALFAISELSSSDLDMAEVLKGIHAIVGSLMYAENFFIVRLDPDHDLMRFLYFVDVEDPAPPSEVRLREREGTLTWYVLHDGKALRGDSAQLQAQVSGPLHFVGTDSHDWMGVPMLREGVVQGALVVQSYQHGIVYSAEDQALLEFVGSHILAALERVENQELLETSVLQRTLELAQANRGLKLEIAERERAERLQAALFQIAQLATADIDEEQFYTRIHDVVRQLLNAENFFIALLSEDRTELQFPYYLDDRLQRSQTHRPIRRGLSEYVLRQAKPLLGDLAVLGRLQEQGEVELGEAGQPAVCWLGVPLLVGAEAVGLVAVQSYDPAELYGPPEQELLEFVASQIANSLNRRRARQIQQEAFAQLEQPRAGTYAGAAPRDPRARTHPGAAQA